MDKALSERLYETYYMKVYSFVMTLAKNKELSEEITQDVFFKAFTTDKVFRGESDEFTWLCAIAKNRFFDEMRRQSAGIDEAVTDTGCVMVAVMLTAMAGFLGCANNASIAFYDADNYSVGDTSISETVENIEIDWPSGTVKLVSHSDNTVLVSETIDSTSPDDIRVHWWLDGTTLHVKFSASGIKLRLPGDGRKELTLTVPDNFKLSDVTVTAASADVNVAGISAEKLDISTASGDMEIECEAKEFCLNSASGEVTLNQVGVAEKVEIDTASGKISAVLGQTGAAVFGSASGDINIKAAAELDNLSVKTASGNIFCEAAVIPQKCELHADSGKVRLTLPENSGFVAKVKSTSGDFNSDFALKKDGSTYISGDGSAEINIKTTSGDVTVRKK